MFGFSHTGSDICGFGQDSSEHLCRRWTQLGAFYPFSRNHNALDQTDQDPGVFSDEFSKMAASVIGGRYRLLPYLYTLLVESHTMGNPVVSPLFFNYFDDENCRDVDEQFISVVARCVV